LSFFALSGLALKFTEPEKALQILRYQNSVSDVWRIQFGLHVIVSEPNKVKGTEAYRNPLRPNGRSWGEKGHTILD
jgi:hypothetical protein